MTGEKYGRAILLTLLMVVSAFAGPAAAGLASQPVDAGGTALADAGGNETVPTNETTPTGNATPVENESTPTPTGNGSDDGSAPTATPAGNESTPAENESTPTNDSATDESTPTENESTPTNDSATNESTPAGNESTPTNDSTTDESTPAGNESTSVEPAAVEPVDPGDSAGSVLTTDGRGWGTVADNDTLDAGSNDAFTLEAWVKPGQGSDENALVLHKKGAWELELRGTGEERPIQFNMLGGFQPAITSDAGLPSGVWTHVAVVVDGSQVSLYIDGELDSQFSDSDTPVNSANDLQFGTNDAANSQFFVGSVDNVRIWDTARGLISIQDNRFVELSGTEPDLAALYQFDGAPTDGPVSDLAGSNDVTLNGDAVVESRDSNPVAPQISAEPLNGSAQLRWAPRNDLTGANDATEFRVYRADNADMDGRTQVATFTDTDRRAFVDSGLANGQTYYYQITAVDDDGEGDYSKAAVVTPYGDARVGAEPGLGGGGGGSLALDGRGYGAVSDRPSVDNLAVGQATIEAWVKPDRSSDPNALIYNKKGAFSLTWNGVGEERTVTFNVPGFRPSITSDTGVHAGEWTHVAVVVDGSQWSLYVNGELDRQFSTGDTLKQSASDLHFGANDPGNDQFYVGRIDEFRAWDTALTDDEIRANYSHEIERKPPSLNAYWRFDEVNNETARGSSRAHSKLTFTGGAGIQRGGAFPVAPQAHAESGNGTATVTWAPREGAGSDTAYKLYRSNESSNDDRRLVATVSNTSRRSYVDTGLANNETYYYEVTRVDADGQESDFQRGATATPYTGEGGASLVLDGSSYGNVSDRASVDNLAGGPATIEFWVKPDSSSDADAYILQKQGAFDVQWRGSGENRPIRFNVPGFNDRITSDAGVRAGVWTHVAVVIDGAQWSMYLNGELDSQISTGDTLVSSGRPLHVGANDAGNDRFFAGSVDNLRMWGDARNETEVTESYDGLLRGDEQGLVHYWRFDDRGVSRSRSTEGKHSEVEMIDGAAVAAPGVSPVPPRVYARGDDGSATVSWRVRARDTARDVNVYGATQRDLSDRSLLTTANASRQSTYEENVSNGATRFYQATTVDADGQESDYAFETGATPSARPAGDAFRFYGSGSYATVQDSEDLELEGNNENQFTYQFWLKYDESSDTDALVLRKDGMISVYLRGDGADRRLEFNLVGGFQPSVRSSGGLAAGEWHHVTVVADGSQLSMYLDGELDSQTGFSGSLSDSASDLKLGTNDAANERFLVGTLDGLRMWNDARTDSEIGENYDNELTGAESNLVAYWRGPFTTGNDTVTSVARRPTTMSLTNVGRVPSNPGVTEGGSGTTTATVSLTSDAGVQTFDVRLNATDGTPVRSVEPGVLSGQQFRVAEGGPGASNVRVQAIDLGTDGQFDGTRVLFNVTFAGNVTAGDLQSTVLTATDRDGDAVPNDVSISLERQSGGGNPFEGPLGSNPGAPADTDGDGKYEDVDGDGQPGTIDDAFALAFDAIPQATTGNLSDAQIDALDFDGSGDLSLNDVFALVFG
jgi:fibronectin type 3 domain-containing protein